MLVCEPALRPVGWRFFYNFYSFLKIFNSILGGDRGGGFHHIGEFFCTDVAKAAILL